MAYELWWSDEPVRLGLQMILRELLRGRRVVVADAANAFDPSLVARAAHRLRLGREILSRAIVSRAFTCHQLEALVRERLAPAARRHRADRAFVLDPGALLYDAEVAGPEALRVGARIARSLELFSAAPATVAMAEPPAERAAVFELFFDRAQAAGRARESGSGWDLLAFKEARHGTDGADLQPGSALRDGRARPLPPRLAAGRAGGVR
jgi:hypothetical protein